MSHIHYYFEFYTVNLRYKGQRGTALICPLCPKSFIREVPHFLSQIKEDEGKNIAYVLRGDLLTQNHIQAQQPTYDYH